MRSEYDLGLDVALHLAVNADDPSRLDVILELWHVEPNVSYVIDAKNLGTISRLASRREMWDAAFLLADGWIPRGGSVSDALLDIDWAPASPDVNPTNSFAARFVEAQNAVEMGKLKLAEKCRAEQAAVSEEFGSLDFPRAEDPSQRSGR